MANYKFYAWFVASKVGKEGLTPTVDIRNSSGTLVVTDGNATELGGGLYSYAYTATVIDDYAAVFKTADATVDSQHVPSLVTSQVMKIESMPADVWASAARTLTGQSANITVAGPVVSGGEIHIVAGDDYKQVDGRALEWSSSVWPDLAGAAVVFHSGIGDDTAMTIVTSGAGEQKVRLELTKAQTAALTAMYEFKIIATLSNSNVATLVKARGYVE